MEDERCCLRKEDTEFMVQEAKGHRLKMKTQRQVSSNNSLKFCASNEKPQGQMKNFNTGAMKSLTGRARVSLLRTGVSKRKNLESILPTQHHKSVWMGSQGGCLRTSEGPGSL